MDELLQEKIDLLLTKTGNKILTTVISDSTGNEYFLKIGPSSSTYQCEANGLKEIARTDTLQTPPVIAFCDYYILTGYIRKGIPKKIFFEKLGKKFALMHRHRNDYFGFYEDNFIGANAQLNIPDKHEKEDWFLFYFNKRLLFQYRLAEKNGYARPLINAGFGKLESIVESLLKDNNEPPTLLHGDLWSGNYLCDKSGNPVVIDPAVYYGNREADLAMTKVFGGFPSSFYEAYQKEYPLSKGWEERENLYKLYHILNHLNLFGEVYLSEAEFIIRSYIKRGYREL